MSQAVSLQQGLGPFSLQRPSLDRSSYYPHTDHSLSYPRRPITPPDDMNSLAPIYRAGSVASQEHGSYHNSLGHGAMYQPVRRDTQDSRAGQVHSRPGTSHQPSPSTSHRSYASTSSHHRKTSQNCIAPALQIPRTINNSQGSLAELAASITCFFWFENATMLDIAKDPGAMSPAQSLQPETIPTTGFRKWVTTMLSTTQVAQNVILLGLLFIYRLKRQNPSVRGKLGSEYRLLTVALMLGNKFLDDNTYTNKTWADVSGISVVEIHIMEVEFLSNMKYNLFTSAEQWADWQVQLGHFARFLDRASNPLHARPSLAAIPASMTLPSPPASFQNSPPRPITPAGAPVHAVPWPFAAAQPAPTRPASMYPTSDSGSKSRKRSLEDETREHAAKRLSTVAAHVSSNRSTPNPSINPQYSGSLGWTGPSSAVMLGHGHQLPPLTQQLRTVPTPYSQSYQSTPVQSAPGQSSMAAALQAARGSRHQSPYPPTTNVSPTNTSALSLGSNGGYGNSPSVYLAQRESPYKPVRTVNKLLVPPPSRAIHGPEHAGNHQMHYQPLGRPLNEVQQGRLPYITQNLWLDPTQQRLAPVTQWVNNIPIPRHRQKN